MLPRAEIELELTVMREILENCSTFIDNISCWSNGQLINYSADQLIIKSAGQLILPLFIQWSTGQVFSWSSVQVRLNS